MATSGYNAHFGKGYLGGGKSEPSAKGPEKEIPHQTDSNDEESEDGQIKQHLEAMHAKTNTAHSHVHHHGDGNHTFHHISAEGEHSGPEETTDCPGGQCGGGM